MYNLLIAEDEKIEREMISKTIQNAFKNELSMICTVDNGEEALRKCNTYDFDLIITDINMPMKDGLQFLQEVKELKPAIRSIILTSYDYFSYAQRSIRLGVDDFILKPATTDDLCNRIRQVLSGSNSHQTAQIALNQEKYQEMLSVVESDCLYAIISDDPSEKINHYFTILNYHVVCGFCVSFARQYFDIQRIKELEASLRATGCYTIHCIYFDYILMYVFCDHALTSVDTQVIQGIFKRMKIQDCYYGIGDVKDRFGDYYHSFRESQERVSLHHEDVLIQNNRKETMIESFVSMLYQQMLHGIAYHQLHIANDIAEKLYQFMLLHDDREYILRSFLNCIQSDDRCADILRRKKEMLEKPSNTMHMRRYLIYVIKHIVDPIMEDRKLHTNRLILESYQYIEKNYHRPIGLNDLADSLHITPQYLSSLLSQHEDNNFTNMLAEYRIEKAKELLAKDERIKDVSFKVGFQNQNYFAKIFKKITEMTPKEYKMMLEKLPI